MLSSWTDSITTISFFGRHGRSAIDEDAAADCLSVRASTVTLYFPPVLESPAQRYVARAQAEAHAQLAS